MTENIQPEDRTAAKAEQSTEEIEQPTDVVEHPTDVAEQPTDVDETTSNVHGSDSAERAANEGQGAEKAREYLLKGALVLLALLGVIATIQFYLSASSAVSQLVSPEFQSMFQAAFNLVILLAVGIGIVQVLRRLQ